MATTEIRRTACSLDCFDACGIVAEVDNGRIVRIGGDPEHPITRGALCNKVNHYLRDRFYHPDRQLHPLRKVNGAWQRLTWDGVLDLIAEKLTRAKERHGTLSVLYHKGNGSFAGLKIMGERFFNLYGGVTQAVGRFCGGEADYGTTQSFGACEIHDPLDLAEHTRLFLIWGRNPAVTNIHMMPVLKAARARGARAIVIDPAVTKTVRYCDGHVQPRPGSDGHLAVGMAKVILAERSLDHARVSAISDHFDDYLALVNAMSMDEIVRRTDLSRETIEALAHDLEAGERAVALVIEHGQRAVALLRAGELLGDQVEGVVPRQALPAAVHPAEGMQLAVGMVEAVAQIVVDLVAERAARDRMLGIAADPHDAAVGDLGHDAAGVEAIEGARGAPDLRRRHRRHAVMDGAADQGGCSW